MEALKLSCEGPAYIIVPLSEDPVRRLLFNDLVDFARGGTIVDDIDDLKLIDNLIEEVIGIIVTDPVLGSTMLADPEKPENREAYRQFHRKLYNRYVELQR
jgi:hypothetical protein